MKWLCTRFGELGVQKGKESDTEKKDDDEAKRNQNREKDDTTEKGKKV